MCHPFIFIVFMETNMYMHCMKRHIPPTISSTAPQLRSHHCVSYMSHLMFVRTDHIDHDGIPVM